MVFPCLRSGSQLHQLSSAWLELDDARDVADMLRALPYVQLRRTGEGQKSKSAVCWAIERLSFSRDGTFPRGSGCGTESMRGHSRGAWRY
jgi:hypothetical protein